MLPWEWSCSGGSVSAAARCPTPKTRLGGAASRMRMRSGRWPGPAPAALHREVTGRRACRRAVQTRTCANTQARPTEPHTSVSARAHTQVWPQVHRPQGRAAASPSCHPGSPQNSPACGSGQSGWGPVGTFRGCPGPVGAPSHWMSLNERSVGSRSHQWACVGGDRGGCHL